MSGDGLGQDRPAAPDPVRLRVAPALGPLRSHNVVLRRAPLRFEPGLQLVVELVGVLRARNRQGVDPKDRVQSLVRRIDRVADRQRRRRGARNAKIVDQVNGGEPQLDRAVDGIHVVVGIAGQQRLILAVEGVGHLLHLVPPDLQGVTKRRHPQRSVLHVEEQVARRAVHRLAGRGIQLRRRQLAEAEGAGRTGPGEGEEAVFDQIELGQADVVRPRVIVRAGNLRFDFLVHELPRFDPGLGRKWEPDDLDPAVIVEQRRQRLLGRR